MRGSLFLVWPPLAWRASSTLAHSRIRPLNGRVVRAAVRPNPSAGCHINRIRGDWTRAERDKLDSEPRKWSCSWRYRCESGHANRCKIAAKAEGCELSERLVSPNSSGNCEHSTRRLRKPSQALASARKPWRLASKANSASEPSNSRAGHSTGSLGQQRQQAPPLPLCRYQRAASLLRLPKSGQFPLWSRQPSNSFAAGSTRASCETTMIII